MAHSCNRQIVEHSDCTGSSSSAKRLIWKCCTRSCTETPTCTTVVTLLLFVFLLTLLFARLSVHWPPLLMQCSAGAVRGSPVRPTPPTPFAVSWWGILKTPHQDELFALINALFPSPFSCRLQLWSRMRTATTKHWKMEQRRPHQRLRALMGLTHTCPIHLQPFPPAPPAPLKTLFDKIIFYGDIY